MPQHSPPKRAARWAISLADLSLLIACAMIMRGGAGGKDAPPPKTLAQFDTAALFYAGEARLHDRGRAALQSLGTRIDPASTPLISVPIVNAKNTPPPADHTDARLSGWELAAARTAAIGRALATESGGRIAPQLAAPSGEAPASLVVISTAPASPQPR